MEMDWQLRIVVHHVPLNTVSFFILPYATRIFVTAETCSTCSHTLISADYVPSFVRGAQLPISIIPAFCSISARWWCVRDWLLYRRQSSLKAPSTLLSPAPSAVIKISIHSPLKLYPVVAVAALAFPSATSTIYVVEKRWTYVRMQRQVYLVQFQRETLRCP